MKYFLGIDGGASKTEVWCADENGSIVGKGLSGPTNLSSANYVDAQKNLQEAVNFAIENLAEPRFFEKAVLGLSGFDTPEEQQLARDIFTPVFSEINLGSWTIVNDSLIALISGMQSQNGIVLISGTGSNCMGKNQEGQVAHVGGMDFLLSDEGSGYDIGRKILRHAVRSFDGRDVKTVLEEKVCQHFQISSINQLKSKIYNPMISKKDVALLASLALDAIKEGDETSSRIVTEAVSDMFNMVSTVMNKLGLSDKNFDLVLVGGLIAREEIHTSLVNKIREVNQQVNIVLPENPPVFGAIKMAMR